MQREISRSFHHYVTSKVSAYLEGINIHARPQFAEGPQWSVARFSWKDKTLSFHANAHHGDHPGSINVYLKTKFGEKSLRSEVQQSLREEPAIYSCSIPQMNAQFDRIIKDMKLHFEKYLLV